MQAQAMLSVLQHPELATYALVLSKCNVTHTVPSTMGERGNAELARRRLAVPTLSCLPAQSMNCNTRYLWEFIWSCHAKWGLPWGLEQFEWKPLEVVSVHQIYKEIPKNRKSCALRLRGSIHLLQSHAVLSCIHTKIKTYMQNVQVFTGHKYQFKKATVLTWT